MVYTFGYGYRSVTDRESFRAYPLGQEAIASSTGNQIWTIHRENQQHQHSSDLKRLISKVGQRIEGVLHEIQQLDWSWRGNPADPLVQNTGRNPERLLNKTVVGFTTHMAAKITSHTLRLVLRLQFGIDVQTFQSTTTS